MEDEDEDEARSFVTDHCTYRHMHRIRITPQKTIIQLLDKYK